MERLTIVRSCWKLMGSSDRFGAGKNCLYCAPSIPATFPHYIRDAVVGVAESISNSCRTRASYSFLPP